MFCTKLGPDNIIKRLGDVEVRAKGMKSIEDRLTDLEKECSSIKSSQIQLSAIEYIEERLGDLEALKPFIMELEQKKIFDMIAAMRREQQQLVDSASWQAMKDRMFDQINQLFNMNRDILADIEDIKNKLNKDETASSSSSDDDDLGKIRKQVKLILTEHIKENILRQIAEQMKEEAMKVVRDAMREHVAKAIQDNAHTIRAQINE